LGKVADTDDIESFWDGLRPPRDPSTFTNVAVESVNLENPVDEESIPYVTRYTVDYGDNSPLEIEESSASFTTIAEGNIITDPPYSSHLSGTDRSNRSLFREIVYATERLRQLLGSAGITYNFTRLIDGIDIRAQDLSIGPEDPRLGYYREMTVLMANSEDTNARR
jgi:hypothetical protein